MKKINSHIYQQPHSYYFILTHTQTHIEQNKLKKYTTNKKNKKSSSGKQQKYIKNSRSAQ